MRYLFLSSALTSVLLGSGLAVAQEQSTDYDQSSQQQQSQQQQPLPTAEQVADVELFFETDSADLSSGANQDLKELADWAKCSSKNAIILEGHADPRGTQDHNLQLSGQRAATVRQSLIDMGVPSERIVVSVFGENGPSRDTMSEERRVTARASDTPVAPEDLSG